MIISPSSLLTYDRPCVLTLVSDPGVKSNSRVKESREGTLEFRRGRGTPKRYVREVHREVVQSGTADSHVFVFGNPENFTI